jgi:hypothetical protein
LPPLAIETLVAEPEAISPNGDGQADATTLTYRLSAPANVTIEVTDAIGGVVTIVVDRVWTAGGEHTVELDGTVLADGIYNVRSRPATSPAPRAMSGTECAAPGSCATASTRPS